jgi:hypothetical protein
MAMWPFIDPDLQTMCGKFSCSVFTVLGNWMRQVQAIYGKGQIMLFARFIISMIRPGVDYSLTGMNLNISFRPRGSEMNA